MTRRRGQAAALAALALAGAVAIGACGANDSTYGNAGMSGRTTATGPTSGWGPDTWSGDRGTGMMGGRSDAWGPGMMGNWWLAGNGKRVQTFDQARNRATAFADRLGLKVGEVMRFSRDFYAELETAGGRPATEVLVDPTDGAVRIEYGPAMMWNTDYGMHHGGQGQPLVSATQARGIAQQWLRDHGGTLTAGAPEPYPGYYTLHTMRSGKITGMLSVNSRTGQVWDHTWHGTYIATGRR